MINRCMICMRECGSGLTCDNPRCIKLVKEFEIYEKSKKINLKRIEKILQEGNETGIKN